MSAVLITYLLLWSVTVSKQTIPPSTTQAINEDTTYNAFTIQWKPQICYKNAHPNCYSDALPNITIHGIWPNYYSGWFPSDCAGNELEYKQIQHLETELQIYWPSLILPVDGGFTELDWKKPVKFWSHEWKKHGTCWHYLNVTQYFEYALYWIKNDYNNMQSILAADNIYPSSEQTYSLSQVTESLSIGLNQNVVLRCRYKRFISEFWVCRDWFGDKIDCPDVLPSNCDDTVVLTVQIPPDPITTTQTTTVRTTVSDDSHSDDSDDSGSEEDVIINDENHDGKPLKIFVKDVDSYTMCVVILIVVIVLVLGCIICYFCLIAKNETHQKIKINMEDIDDNEAHVDDEYVVEMINSTSHTVL